MKKLFWILILVVGFLTLAQANEKVRMAIAKTPLSGLMLIAHDKGFFNDEGLDVEIQSLQSGRNALDSVLAGSAEMAFVGDAPVAYLGYIQVVATLMLATNNAIVARKSSGILKPRDLRGKRVAYSPGTTSAVFAYRFLKKYGMSTSDVQMQGVQPIAIPTYVIAKGGDAASTWDVYVSQTARQLGADAIVFREPSIYTTYAMDVANRSWTASHPGAVAKVLRALGRASAFIKDNPEETKKLLIIDCAMDRESMNENWPYFDFTLRDAAASLPQVKDDGQWIHDTQEGYQNKPLPDYSIYFPSADENAKK